MGGSEKIIIRLAVSKGELDKIFGLRYQSYLEKGYISENPSKLLYDEWDGLDATTHIVAIENDQITGAVRIVRDSRKGLPMERVFKREITDLRRQGRVLAEASTLVTAKEDRNSKRLLWLRLCRAVWREAQACRINDLCIAVTPNHLSFYKRLLFETIGNPERYSSLNGILAYPMRLRVEDVTNRHKSQGGNHDRFLRGKLLE